MKRLATCILSLLMSSASPAIAVDLWWQGPEWMPQLAPDFRFNRVEEGQLALRGRHDLPYAMHAHGQIGFSTGLERVSFTVAARRSYAWRAGTTWLEANVHRGSGSHYGSDTWPQFVNTVQTLLAMDDYFDYYWNQGAATTFGHDLSRWQGKMRLSWHDEDHASLAKTTDRDLFGRSEVLRPNPAVDEGHMRRLGLSMSLGGDYQPFRRGVNRRVEVNVEHSADWMGGDFDFTLYHAEGDWSQPTWRRGGDDENRLDLRVTMGSHSGRLPVQRFGALDVGVGPLSQYGTLRAASGHPFLGERYLAVFAEHDFDGMPFEWVGLGWLSRNGFELAVNAAHGQTWIDADRRAALPMIPRWTKVPHREVGGSLVLFDLVRVDLTRRIDPGAWAAGINLTRYDWLGL